MIGLLGARIWVENRVDLGNPVNLVPIAGGVVAGIGDVTLKVTDDFSLGGIALGTILVLAGYHGLRLVAPPHLRAAYGTGPSAAESAGGGEAAQGSPDAPRGG